MQKSTKAKIVGGATAIVMACGLAVAGSSLTSAYFSNTNTGGAINASYGSIYVDVDGKEFTTPDLNLSGMLPGESRSAEFTFTNSGKSAQDTWATFDDDAVLKAVNQLGRKASIEIKVNGQQIFFSDNLNDGYPNDPTVKPLPKQLQLIEGLAAGESATVEFTMGISEDFTSQLVAAIPVSLPYSIVATQVGIAPGA